MKATVRTSFKVGLLAVLAVLSACGDQVAQVDNAVFNPEPTVADSAKIDWPAPGTFKGQVSVGSPGLDGRKCLVWVPSPNNQESTDPKTYYWAPMAGTDGSNCPNSIEIEKAP